MATPRRLLIAGALIAGMVAGPLGPALRTARADNANENTHAQLGVFAEVLSLVRRNYVFKEPTKKLVYNAINGMLSSLDPHSNFMNRRQYRIFQGSSAGDFGGLGMDITERSGKLVIVSVLGGTPAAATNIRSGDIIAGINGKPTAGLSLEQAVEKLRGPAGSMVELAIKRPHLAAPMKITLTRAIIHVDPVKARLVGNVGYMRLSIFSAHANRDLRKAVRTLDREDHGDVSAFILDLRNNPGGLLNQGIAVADDFLNSGEIVATRGRRHSDDRVWYAHHGDVLDGKPLVVIINAGTASAAEIVTAALQQNRRAVVLGVRSFGKGSVQTIFPIRGYGAVRMTTALDYTPSGQSLQGYGVAPDIVVHETRTSHEQRKAVRDSSLPHAIGNPSGLHAPTVPPKVALPAMARSIAPRPPKGWPKHVRGNPSTDYQLQMALRLARAMAAQSQAGHRA